MTRVLITIPDKLLKQIDRKAKAEYETRSSYFRELVYRDIKKSSAKPRSNAKQVFSALAKARRLKWNFPDGVEYVRSIRGNWERAIPKN